jgi:hypothetical protein
VHLARYIIKYFIIPLYHSHPEEDILNTDRISFQCIKIRLEKPTAVTLADVAGVEFFVDSNPRSSETIKKLWQRNPQAMQGAVAPPFPLQGRLDEWVEKMYPGEE